MVIYSFIYIVAIGVFLSIFIGYMWLTTLEPIMPIGSYTFIPSIIYIIDLCAIPISGLELSKTISFTGKIVVNVIVGIICVIAIILGKLLSIDRYKEEGCVPSYGAFMLICGYSITIFVLSFFSLFFSAEISKIFA